MSSFLFADISLLTEKGSYIPHAFVGVSDKAIEYVGTDDPREVSHGVYDEIYDGRGKLLMPGLYNAHSHVPMTLLRGRGENLDLDHWLNDSIFPFEDHIQDNDAYVATMLGIAEMLRFGVVSFSDMYYQSDARAKAIIESGAKANLGHSIVCFDPEKEYADLDACKLNEHLVRDYHKAADGRLLIDFNLHAEYTSTPKIAHGLADAAVKAGVRMQVHVSETKGEVEGCKERHGLSPVAYLKKCGLFDVPTTAAHCVWLDDDDYRILSESNVFVATCPASNAKLGSGIADVLAMKKADIVVSLGTDGVASNNNLNMFKDLYLLALMQRAKDSNPRGLSSSELIEIATRSGAFSQGRDDCGMIQVGARADLIVLDIDTPWMTPVDSMSSNLVYSAEGSDVVLTMVDGSVLYKEGDYLSIDIERMKYEVIRSREAIVSKLGEGV